MHSSEKKLVPAPGTLPATQLYAGFSYRRVPLYHRCRALFRGVLAVPTSILSRDLERLLCLKYGAGNKDIERNLRSW